MKCNGQTSRGVSRRSALPATSGLVAGWVLIALAGAIPGEGAAQQANLANITFQRFLTNPKLQTVATENVQGAAGLAAIANGVSRSTVAVPGASQLAITNQTFQPSVLTPGTQTSLPTPWDFGRVAITNQTLLPPITVRPQQSQAERAVSDFFGRGGGGPGSPSGGSPGSVGSLGGSSSPVSDEGAPRPSTAVGGPPGPGGVPRSPSTNGPGPATNSSGGGANAEPSSSVRGADAPADVGSAGLGGQLVARLDARTAATATGAVPAGVAPGESIAEQRSSADPSPAATRASQPTDEPVTVLVMVGGRGLAADADLGRSTPLSGAAPNVFCTVHTVAVGANLDPGAARYFAPRHNCR